MAVYTFNSTSPSPYTSASNLLTLTPGTEADTINGDGTTADSTVWVDATGGGEQLTINNAYVTLTGSAGGEILTLNSSGLTLDSAATPSSVVFGTGTSYIEFTSASSVLANDSWNGMSITGMAPGDGFVMPPGYTITAYTYASGQLNLTVTTPSGSETIYGLSLSGTDSNGNALSQGSFVLSSDGSTLSDGPYVGPVVCYLRGTRVLTPTGQIAVEDLKVGDLLVTCFGGIQSVQWIGRQAYSSHSAPNLREVAPVRINAGALGDNQPARDLYVSPGHSMLVDGQLLLAKLLVNGVTITQELSPDKIPPLIEYFQVDFGIHDCIVAEGTWSESFADGPGLRDQFHNVAEFYALNPSYRPPEELTLCAPRPEAGARLEAALRPITARAEALVMPGKLRGWIDFITLPWTIVGWAQDEEHPDLPVLLEILLDGKSLGVALSCAHRQDLFEAGLGRGQSGFRWTSPVTLPHDAKDRLHIRRVVDGAVLPGSVLLPQPERPYLHAVA